MWIELCGPESCLYRLEDPWEQPMGRLEQYLQPISLDPQAVFHLLDHLGPSLGRGAQLALQDSGPELAPGQPIRAFPSSLATVQALDFYRNVDDEL
jgi:hypothetical protein